MGLFSDLTKDAIKGATRAMANNDKKVKSSQVYEELKKKQPEQEKKIEEMYQHFIKTRSKTFKDLENKGTIQGILKEIIKVPEIERDYSLFDQLSTESRQSDEFKNALQSIKDVTYESAVKAYIYDDKSVQNIMLMLKPLLYFEEIRLEIQHSLTHLDYFTLYNQDIKSVLTGCENIGEKIDKINDEDDLPMEKLQELIDSIYSTADLVKQEKYQEAFDCIVCADFDESIYENCKRKLLYLSTLGNASSTEVKSFEYMKDIINLLFQSSRLVRTSKDRNEYQFVRIPVVDMLIADSIKLDQSGMIDSIDEELKHFLSSFSVKRDEEDAEQYEVLSKFYQCIKAYKQEKIVLEFMVVNNIPRTEEQEKRLMFLKNNNSYVNGSNLSNAPNHISYEAEEGKIVYDYRSVSWNDSQIKSYVNAFSNDNEIMNDLMVIDDWNNNLDINNVKWNIDDLLNDLNNCLIKNYGEKYVLNMVKSGVLEDGWIEYDDSILIKEMATHSKYPWIKFIVNAEQLTLSQVSFSIYTLYDPKEDFKNETDCFKINSAMGNKLASIILKQNPKINNYISVVKNIIISELENYLNGNSTSENIY